MRLASSVRSASTTHPTPAVRHALVAAALSLGLAVGLVAAAGEPAQAQDERGPWPQWLKDVDHSRQADAVGPDEAGWGWGIDVAELTPEGADEPYSELRPYPTLSPEGDVLVQVAHPDDGGTLSTEGRLLALDGADGSVRWELPGIRAECGQSVDSQGRIWVERWTDDALEAVDAATGEPIAGTRLENAFRCTRDRANLHLGGDPEHLVVPGGRGGGDLDGLAAYDISGDTPAEAWQVSADDGEFDELIRAQGRQTQVLVTDDAVYVAVATEDADEVLRPELIEIDLATGDVVDRVGIPLNLEEAEHDQPRAADIRAVHFVRVDGTLVLGVITERLSDARGLLAGVDLTTDLDEIAWESPTGPDGEYTRGPRGLTVSEGLVALRDDSAGSEPLRAYDPADGSRVWTGELSSAYPTTGYGGRLSDADGALYAHAPGAAVDSERSAVTKLDAQGQGEWYVSDAAIEDEMGLDDADLEGDLVISALDEGLLVVTEDPTEGTRVIALDDSGGLAEPWPGDEPAQAEPGEPGVARVEGPGTGQPRDIAIELCRLQHDDGTVDRLALARDDEFADALAGSALPGVGCILFTPGGPGQPLNPEVRAEIDRVTGGLADIYLLGGDQAVSAQVEQELDQAGYGIARLEGTTRFETAEAIAQAAARAVATPREEVIVANGLDWVDAITSGAYAAREVAPVVLTPRDQLHPAAERVLDGLDPQRTWVVGGTAVVSSQAANATPNPQRVAGTNRMGTAVAVAEQMWPGVDGFAGDTYVTANLQRGDGWVPALAATRLSAAWNAPQLGVWTDAYPGETSDYLQRQGFAELPSVTLLGDVGFVSDDTADAIRSDIAPD